MRCIVIFIVLFVFKVVDNLILISPLKECVLPSTNCIPRSQCSKGFQAAINNSTDDVLYFLMTSYCGFQHEPLHCCKTDCMTPNGDYGLCKPLAQCQYFNTSSVELDFLALSVRACNKQSHSQIVGNRVADEDEEAEICCSDKEDVKIRKVTSPFVNVRNDSANGNIKFDRDTESGERKKDEVIIEPRSS